jgi:hypothetical protein
MASERRKFPRLGLAIPLRVQGFLPDRSTWEEFSTTTDVSSGGACFPLVHEVDLGQVLLLSFALPKRLRQYDLNEVTYRIYTLVRGVRRRSDRPRIGVMFFGKFPPRGFDERPSARYLLPSDSVPYAPAPHGLREGFTPPGGIEAIVKSPSPEETLAFGDVPDFKRPAGQAAATPPPPAAADPAATPAPPLRRSGRPRSGVPPAPPAGANGPDFFPSRELPADRRSAPRFQVFVNFTIQLVDEWGAVLQEELTVADNVARGGTRVMTSLSFHVGDVILLQEAGGGFATRAEVRGVTRVQTAIDRLHLRFIDRQAPDRLLRL